MERNKNRSYCPFLWVIKCNYSQSINVVIPIWSNDNFAFKIDLSNESLKNNWAYMQKKKKEKQMPVTSRIKLLLLHSKRKKRSSRRGAVVNESN